ncbi:DNA-methyltransferase [Chryseobacterium sp. MFBS3-17]|uniref:DNA-methyltransferase n=1 Tax=Chryseobacterium sp. MFBS3-17 TaxID=2886689 RepID=UPI001D0DDFB4|nr:site-specific DNA-methyltransferase [Chryseobacterium sp. MFBS3-17]MCC2590333.1 site-specific DNA-methyltransferase [Chryseobacterium sp. MFBS3-17]
MIELYNEDNKDLMARLPNESIDVICIDPPYLYLKNQKLERPFDEKLFFSECKRVLTKNGFIVLFGRGTSFYRWNTILDSLGFKFKEEIVWNKTMNSIPAAPILRVHELINVYTKNSGKLNSPLIPYIEAKQHNLDSIYQDLKRIKSAINSKEFEDIEHFLKTGEIIYKEKKSRNFFKNAYSDRSRGLATFRTIKNGMKEKTIMTETRDHYRSIHPTQKPVRLLERLLALVIPDKPKNEIMVADFFGGSFSTMEAVFNMGMQGISCEIDKEYFEAGKQRIDNLKPNLFSSEL